MANPLNKHTSHVARFKYAAKLYMELKDGQQSFIYNETATPSDAESQMQQCRQGTTQATGLICDHQSISSPEPMALSVRMCSRFHECCEATICRCAIKTWHVQTKVKRSQEVRLRGRRRKLSRTNIRNANSKTRKRPQLPSLLGTHWSQVFLSR